MTAEINSSLSFRVNKGNLNDGKSLSESTDMTGAFGPSPGGIAISIDGTDVNLGALATPGECILVNLDPTNYVEWGLKTGGVFYPFGELLAGKFAKVRFSRHLGVSETEPGTHTSGAATFHMRANAANCDVQVLAYEA